MKIDPAIWPALSRLLDEWFDLPVDSRASWLAKLGPEYSEVLPALRQLLASQACADDDILRTIPKFDESPLTLSLGERLGPYRILSTLGRGGMGIVYEGKRDAALRLLREAIDHGLSPADSLGLERDPNLKSLHGDPPFEVLVSHAKERAGAAQNAK